VDLVGEGESENVMAVANAKAANSKGKHANKGRIVEIGLFNSLKTYFPRIFFY
jgi:hypothetical protein